MFRRLKKSMNELKRYPPGERFQRRYAEHRQESPVAGVAYIGLGIVLVVVGIVFSFWPVIPGFVFLLPGLAMLAARLRWVAVFLDRTELVGRKYLARWRTWRKKPHPARGRAGSHRG